MNRLPRHLAPSAGSAVAAAVLLSILGTGCQTPRTRGASETNTFTISFKADPTRDEPGRFCPTKVVVDNPERQCTEWFSKKEDCLKTLPGDSVKFVARREGSAKEAKDLAFSLRFAPFPEGAIPVTEGERELKIPPDAPRKTYTYNVYSGSCPVKDPQIIIEE